MLEYLEIRFYYFASVFLARMLQIFLLFGGNMQVIFIHHSCFLVELDQMVLIFDYFDGNKVDSYDFRGNIPTYSEDTPIYLFASHCHKDHYDLDTLRWTEKYKNIKYIFSKDIKISPNFLKKHGIDPQVRERVTFVSPSNNYKVDDIEITTLKSTDAGVAFYINVNGVYIFYAGDLNDWTWEGVGDLINGRQRKAYRHEISRLSDKPIHLAFVPMDSRLNVHQADAIDYFVRNTDAEFIFPMHMWKDYSGIAKYIKRLTNKALSDRIIDISRENQVFPIEENY